MGRNHAPQAAQLRAPEGAGFACKRRLPPDAPPTPPPSARKLSLLELVQYFGLEVLRGEPHHGEYVLGPA